MFTNPLHLVRHYTVCRYLQMGMLVVEEEWEREAGYSGGGHTPVRREV
jgi:hypothetical protein